MAKKKNTQTQELALLPTGFVDLLGADATQEAQSIDTLMSLFARYGYERIKPPMAEYEDSLLAPGPGAALAGETFRLMDPQTQKMLGIRADITPQISRIARSRYEKTARPLRLAYANDVLRTRGGQDRFARQFCQVGAEIIGDEGLDAFIECAVLAVQGLDRLGLKNISLDLTLPRLVDQLFVDHKVTPDAQLVIGEALDRRASDGLDRASARLRKVLKSLLDCQGAAADVLEGISKISLPRSSKSDVKALGAAVAAIQAAFVELGIEGVQITIDPLERRMFEYYNGVAFVVFSQDARGELGRGGRYNVSFGEGDEPPEAATGFTLYMDSVRRALPAAKSHDVLAVPYAIAWSEIQKLHNEGWVVVRGREKDVPKAATHRYKNGKITAL